MMNLRSKQVLFLSVIGGIILVYVLAARILSWLLYGVSLAILVYVWIEGLQKTIKGKNPFDDYIDPSDVDFIDDQDFK